MKNITNNIINFIKRNDLLLGTIAVVLLSFATYYMIMLGGQNASENFSDKSTYILMRDTTINWQKTVILYDNVDKIGIIVNPVKYKNIYTFNRMYAQLNTIKYRAMAHNKAIDFFIIHLYFFISIQIVFMIIVVILGAIISKKGWGDSPNKLLLTFLIACGFLLFFQIFPKGMKMDSNLKQNKYNYKLYCSVENDVLTYLATEDVDDNFVKDLDALLKDYHAISFDLEEVPFSAVKNQFDEIRKSSENGSSRRDREKAKSNVIYVPVYTPDTRMDMIKSPSVDTTKKVK